MLTHALHASFTDSADQRGSNRRVLRLEARLASPAGAGGAQVHNLSPTGMLVESAVALPAGETIVVELPGGESRKAEIVWADGGLLGCRFLEPLPPAALSAALLRSAPAKPQSPPTPRLTQDEALAKLREHWDFEPEPEAAAPAGADKLAPGVRMWIIGALALAAWAAPALVIWLIR